jgi:sugar phosphate permease
VGGLATMLAARVMLGFGEGATFPTATRAMSDWTPAGKRGFAQGITHSSARLGNAITPPLVVWLIGLVTWLGSFILLGSVSLAWAIVWLWYFRDDPGGASRDRTGGTGSAPAIRFAKREKERSGAVASFDTAYASRDGSVLLLSLDALALPGLDPHVLSSQLQARLENVGVA